MEATLKFTRKDIETLVKREFKKQFPLIEPEIVSIETKSKQNYKSEWESADFRASVTYQTSPLVEDETRLE